MKIKGVIEDLKFFLIKKKKNDHNNSKNISRTFSGVVVGSVGSVHFRIVPWSGLYFFFFKYKFIYFNWRLITSPAIFLKIYRPLPM